MILQPQDYDGNLIKKISFGEFYLTYYEDGELYTRWSKVIWR